MYGSEMVTHLFSKRDNSIPSLNASVAAKHKHEPTMRAVRVNGQITEVKHRPDHSWQLLVFHCGFHEIWQISCKNPADFMCYFF